jgi:DNA-binding NarL/FixJ family response regulator
LFKRLNCIGICIVISGILDGDSIIKAIKAGAVGYLHKDNAASDIINKIKEVRSWVSPMSPDIAYNLIKSLQVLDGNSTMPLNVNDKQQAILTKKKVQVINLISKGFTYRETATFFKVVGTLFSIFMLRFSLLPLWAFVGLAPQPQYDSSFSSAQTIDLGFSL